MGDRAYTWSLRIAAYSHGLSAATLGRAGCCKIGRPAPHLAALNSRGGRIGWPPSHNRRTPSTWDVATIPSGSRRVPLPSRDVYAHTARLFLVDPIFFVA